ncbi:hypothetical protein VMT65_33000 [Nocardia sp. CDC153]|uniref:hypothetical protein n=1 Tax=Nocardia sp. CDC153 TaxID=3112167 RepID=UPI002DBC4B34|nr:hypothetical protein [Nocardia sp. CDC153]MEC3957894.1 hypothetical protein [Nocardia sp. CDC153]
MNRRTRLYQFPGGMFELQGTSDEPEDDEGFYLQFYDFFALHGHEDRGVVMRYKPTALGYVRTDVSGIGQLWDESQIRKLATRLGYDFSGMIVYDPATERPPLARLKARATRLDAEAVIVPSPAHFERGEIPGTLVQQLDVITVSPEQTYARRSMPPIRDVPPAQAGGA